MSWTRKIPRINLSEGSRTSESPNMEWANQYPGSRGSAARYLGQEIDPQCDALGPDNKLIMASGPLSGIMAPTSGRCAVSCKGSLTGEGFFTKSAESCNISS